MPQPSQVLTTGELALLLIVQGYRDMGWLAMSRRLYYEVLEGA